MCVHLQVLGVLGSADDQRAVENDLVLLLGFEHFELIKTLISNRWGAISDCFYARLQPACHLDAVVSTLGNPHLPSTCWYVRALHAHPLLSKGVAC